MKQCLVLISKKLLYGSIIDANKTAVHGYSYIELLNMKLKQLRHSSMMGEYKRQMDA